MTDAVALKRTPLHDRHVAAGAKLVDFAGWEMPVQYAGVMEEHRAVRNAAGLFDVSHMGEFRVRGSVPGAADAFVQSFTPNDVSKLTPGRAHYSALLTPEGTFVDDLLVYRIGADEFLIVVNAGGIDVDFAWISALPRPAGVELVNESDAWALLALQGPNAVEILQALTATPLAAIKYYHFAQGEVDGRKAILSRTGYTGEDGFELYVAPADAGPLWDRLVAAGAQPAGLGARDTLRLEAGMALYGHEIDRETTPWEVGLDWIVKLDKGEFAGREALVAARAKGPAKRLIGFEVEGRGIARQGHKVVAPGGGEVGVVTSGTFSPTLEKAIGMAHVESAFAATGTPIEIDVRGKRVAARVVALPFYKRKKS
jgi:aminomethyltransferase